MVELQSKFQNLNAKVNQGLPNVDDRQKIHGLELLYNPAQNYYSLHIPSSITSCMSTSLLLDKLNLTGSLLSSSEVKQFKSRGQL